MEMFQGQARLFREVSMCKRCGLVAGLLMGLVVAWLPAAERADVSLLLNRKIIAPRLPTTEIQAYCEPRVPAVPVFASAAEWEQYAERLRREILENIVFRG